MCVSRVGQVDFLDIRIVAQACEWVNYVGRPDKYKSLFRHTGLTINSNNNVEKTKKKTKKE